MKGVPTYLSCILFLFGACGESPKTEDDFLSPSQLNSPLVENIQNYTIDSVKSFITWTGRKTTERHNGIIHIAAGNIILKDSAISGGNILIDMSQIEVLDLVDFPSQQSEFMETLRSVNFFDAASYPRATFEIIDVARLDVPAGTKKKKGIEFSRVEPTHTITGTLTIRGLSKKITFPARLFFRNNKLEGSANFTLDRTEWGIKYLDQNDPALKADNTFIYNQVDVGFEIIAFLN